ncbi:MAG TPA: toll/interleukin-1 receptor domain-containing protein [Chloroflexia bacterium]|nr:toll/interleukin-1 receptor domain-containing protein [Chloroflexia bacterium]
MANPEHLEILKQGVGAWTTWRLKYPDVHPNLSDVNLSGAKLYGMDLSGAKLNGADLNGMHLIGMHFNGAELNGANLNGAELVGAHLNGAELNGARLVGAHLVGARLVGARLVGARLLQADLSEADLTEAELFEAHLMGTALRKAVLRRADLREADLRVADLTEADLTEANLTDAKLMRAKLIETLLNNTILDFTRFSAAEVAQADFTEARAMETVFSDMDLSEARGLETVIHFGPSTIGIDTIFKSKGKIPEVFLRGAGVPEILITYLPSLLSQPIQFYSCFISYSHKDKAFARRLHDTLQGRGIRCWLDEHQLLPGDDIYEQIDRGIRLWDKVLLCCSESSLASWWVENEIETAFGKEQALMKERGKRVLALIPLNLDGHLFRWENGKAQQVKNRLAADFRGWEKDNSIFEEQVERVVKALQTGDTGREPPPMPRL